MPTTDEPVVSSGPSGCTDGIAPIHQTRRTRRRVRDDARRPARACACWLRPRRARGGSAKPSKPATASKPSAKAAKPATKPSAKSAKESTTSSKPATSAAAATTAPPASTRSGRPTDPDGGVGETHALLTAAVDEAARLLDADGAMVYLLDEATGRLRFAHDAGIRSAKSRAWVRSIELEPGTGMFGRAVAERSVVVTEDYPSDTSFRHAQDPDRVVDDIGIRSMVVAPLVAGDAMFGALGTFSRRPHAFDAAQIALVRSLADHAAAAMANARLIEALDRSRTELAERAEVERTLREINARISGAADLSGVLQRTVDEAARLLRADGARIDLIDARSGLLRWAYASGAVKPDLDIWPDDPDETVDQGISGQAVSTGRAFWTGDYIHDERFPHGIGADTYIKASGISSVMAAPLIGEAGPFGALTVFVGEIDAWSETDAALLEAIADQAAITITTTRLIEELASSKTELARTADAERTLREIAATVSAMRDEDEILQAVVDAATRLLGGTGAMVDLIAMPYMAGAWSNRGVDARIRANAALQDEFASTPEAGVSGLAMANRRVERTGDYLADERFDHTAERDAFVRKEGIQSVIAAPLLPRGDVMGAITVYADVADAFDDADAALLTGLADQAAVAIANVHLIRELERSRTEIARRADAEQTLREIAARVSAILDPAEVLQRIVDEAARLLESDGSRIDLYDPELDALRWSYAAGPAMAIVPDWARTSGLKANQAVAGTAFAEQRPVRTDDYLADDRFMKDDMASAFVREAGIRSVVAVPLAGDAGPLGTLSVVSRQPGAVRRGRYRGPRRPRHAGIHRDHQRPPHGRAGAVAARHPAARRRRGDAARDRGADHRDPRDGRAAPARRGRGAAPAARRRCAHRPVRSRERHAPVGVRRRPPGGPARGGQDDQPAAGRGRVGQGRGRATGHRGGRLPRRRVPPRRAGRLARGRRRRAGPDRRADHRRQRAARGDRGVQQAAGGIRRDRCRGPWRARRAGRHRDHERPPHRRAGALADGPRATSRDRALAARHHRPDRRAPRPRRDPHPRRRGGQAAAATDGAHLTRMHESGTYLVPVVAAGESDEGTRSWLLGMEFPLGDGINGLAAELGTPIWTFDYLVDPRIPHEPSDLRAAARLGLRGMAAAPLRAPGGEVIGTLAISTAEPRTFEADELDLLQGLADQAAIALTNSNLLERITREEARFRGLVQTMPDVIWRADAEGVFTFMADSGETLFGWPIEEVIGKHFEFLTEASTMPIALEAFAASAQTPELIGRVPLVLVRRDGTTFNAEVTVTGVFEDDRFVGAQGTVRDVSERERLERELRESEERYRYLVQNAPDLVWSIDADSRLRFLSDACERLTGFKPEELIGQHFGSIVHESSREVAEIDWTLAMAAPSQELRGRINLQHRDGSAVPSEFIAVATLDADGRFAGANGSVRDMREHTRLERELRDSQLRYKTLASSSPDLVFATDAEGRYTFLSDRAATMLGWDLATSLGRPFSDFVAPGWEEAAAASYAALIADPAAVHTARIDFLRGDGSPVPLEINVIGSFEDDQLTGIHGVARDVSERERLQLELRRSEERYRFLIEKSPDAIFATDADGNFTFMSAAIERLTGLRAEDLIGQHFSTVIDAKTLPLAAERWAALNADPALESQASLVLRGLDGRLTPVDVRAIGLVAEDRFVGIQGATRDVSVQVGLERELRRQAGELAAGEERAHLARELHDSVTQALFSMTLVSRSVELLLDRDADAARVQLGQLRELQREALAEMRALIFELRPGNLEQDGLVRALKTHTAALQGRIGLPVVVESDVDGRLPLEVEEGLYRIAQEALHNVVKHAAARQVRLELRQRGDGVTLRIEDDGKGFDPEAVPDGHLGIAGMRARADRLGATLHCDSQPGRGTRIEVELAAAAIAAARATAAAAASASAGASELPDAPVEPVSIRDG